MLYSSISDLACMTSADLFWSRCLFSALRWHREMVFSKLLQKTVFKALALFNAFLLQVVLWLRFDPIIMFRYNYSLNKDLIFREFVSDDDPYRSHGHLLGNLKILCLNEFVHAMQIFGIEVCRNSYLSEKIRTVRHAPDIVQDLKSGYTAS